MNALRTLWRELAGLFVEDPLFALAIALWLAAIATAFGNGVVPVSVRGGVLFAGLAAILIASVLRAVRRPRS